MRDADELPVCVGLGVGVGVGGVGHAVDVRLGVARLRSVFKRVVVGHFKPPADAVRLFFRLRIGFDVAVYVGVTGLRFVCDRVTVADAKPPVDAVRLCIRSRLGVAVAQSGCVWVGDDQRDVLAFANAKHGGIAVCE